jgi:hypothetical protein
VIVLWIDAQEAVKTRAAPFQLKGSGMVRAKQRQQLTARQSRFLSHFCGGSGGDV